MTSSKIVQSQTQAAMNLHLTAFQSSKTFSITAIASASFFDQYEMMMPAKKTSKIRDPLHSHKFEREMGTNYVPGPTDIICARGKLSYNHSGNKWFRSLVSTKVDAYKNAKSKIDKSVLVTAIMEIVNSAEPRGSFIRKHDDVWYEVAEHISREKVGQCFRDLMMKGHRQSPVAVSSPKGWPADESMSVDKVTSLSLQEADAATKSSVNSQTGADQEGEDAVEPYSYEESLSDKPLPPPLEFAETIERRLSLPSSSVLESMAELDPSNFSPRPIYEGPQVVSQSVPNNSAFFPLRHRSAPSALAAFGGFQNNPLLSLPSLQNHLNVPVGIPFSSSSSWTEGTTNASYQNLTSLSTRLEGLPAPRRGSIGRSTSYPGHLSAEQKDAVLRGGTVLSGVGAFTARPAPQVTSVAPIAAVSNGEHQNQQSDEEDTDVKMRAAV